jgi:glycosyltransferase involved in cell wall biosynthesis
MPERPKLLFLIPDLGLGGSQKVLSVLLRNLTKGKFDISLCVLIEPGVFFDSVPDEVHKINLRISRVRYSAWGIYKVIRRTQPDLVFVFDVNHLNLFVGIISFFLSRKIKYVTREAVVLSTFIDNYPKYKRFLWGLYRFSFTRFNLIICQSFYMRDDLIKNFRVPSKMIRVINNPLEVKRILDNSKEQISTEKKAGFNIVAVGRIVYVKGFDLLIESLNLIKNLNFHLTIIGEKTPENPGYKDYIISLIEKYNLDENISFVGYTINPHKHIANSDLLVISSRTEAFSNVAIEANALGVPVVAFNSPGGMAEIIEEGVNGWLVTSGDIKSLAKTIFAVSQLKINSQEIARYTKKRYDAPFIIPQYEQAITEVL